MDIQPLDIVIHIINIVVLFVLLRLLIYKPLYKFMQGRKQRIADGLDEAKKRGEEAEAIKGEYEGRLASVEKEAGDKVIEVISAAHTEAERIVNEAHADADGIIADAKKRAEKEYDRKLGEMESDIKDISIEIASQILSREVSEADNSAIVDDFFKKEDKRKAE